MTNPIEVFIIDESEGSHEDKIYINKHNGGYKQNGKLQQPEDLHNKLLSEQVVKFNLTEKEFDDFIVKSPNQSLAFTRLQHQSSLGTGADVEDRKTLREVLYQGIFHRHRRTIFAVGSFLRMLRNRNSQYNNIRSSSESDDISRFR